MSRPRRKPAAAAAPNVAKFNLTCAQEAALRLIRDHVTFGVRPTGDACLADGRWHKFDVRTLLCLCARGLLEANGDSGLKLSPLGTTIAKLL